MSTVVLFVSYILISMMFTWKFVDFIKVKQWDIKSAKIILAIFVTLIGILLLSVRVMFLGGIEEGPSKEMSLTLILGSVIIIVIMLLSLWVMHLVRKMKYMEVTFKIPINDPSKGSLSEDNMVCLVDRERILNVKQVIDAPDPSNQIKNTPKDELDVIEPKKEDIKTTIKTDI